MDKFENLLVESKHWDGHKREKAVKKLGEQNDPQALPALFARVNDWAWQVRQEAREAIVKLANHDNATTFIEYLPQLYHLRHCLRDSHADFISSIESRILSVDNLESIINGISNDNKEVSRICLAWIIDNKMLGYDEIFSRFFSHPDEMIRTRVATLIRYLESGQQSHALTLATNDRSMLVRQEAFKVLQTLNNNLELIERFLFDRHISLRQMAVHVLKKSKIDVKRIYLQSLDSTNSRLCCCGIFGITELNGTEFIDHIKSFLASPIPVVRKHSIYALSKLTGADVRETLIKSLSDVSPAVCREAGKWLVKLQIKFSAEDLLNIIDNSSYAHTTAYCIKIATWINKWERLIFLLNLWDEKYLAKLAYKDQIESAIKVWDKEFNNGSLPPSESQCVIIREKCHQHHKRLSSHDSENVIFALKSLGIVS